jgi:hypothetical protein
VNPIADQIGFSQRIRLEWFEQTANLVLARNDKEAINTTLQTVLKDKVSVGGIAERGNREKIISILMKVWVNASPNLEAFRNNGLELMKRLPQKNHIAVHWGMVMAVYPFWAAVAGHTGRLLKLQSTVAAPHVQRRMREEYGERETVSRAARRVLRSFVDWDILKETKNKGVYCQGLSLPIHYSKLVAWLAEAILYTRSNGSAATRDLLDNPSLFPFHLKTISAENLVAISPRLDLLRHGLNDDLIMLKSRKKS